MFSSLLNSRTHSEYKAKFQNMIDSLPIGITDELNKINALRFKSCLAFTSGFSGINISDGRNESLHNRLKYKIPRSQSYHSVLEILLKFSTNVNETASLQYEI